MFSFSFLFFCGEHVRRRVRMLAQGEKSGDRNQHKKQTQTQQNEGNLSQQDDYHTMTVVELRQACTTAGLDAKGPILQLKGRKGNCI